MFCALPTLLEAGIRRQVWQFIVRLQVYYGRSRTPVHLARGRYKGAIDRGTFDRRAFDLGDKPCLWFRDQ